MMKHRIVCLFVTVAAGIGLATAQNSHVGKSSSKPGSDPTHTATKPLTPKSAMPTQHKSSAVAPNASNNGRNATAELTRLERQKTAAGGPKSGSTGPAKVAPVKSADASVGSGSKINSKYQKPAGGLTATNPGANSKGSGTPRVNKKN